ncbi:hypothetical protein DMENIID0001_079400 [Sergentomyia squamirostris]
MPGEETSKTTPVSSPNLGKKFVQTRLPFKILSPGSSNKADGTPKRRLSSPVIEDRASKVLKTTPAESEEDVEDFSNPDAIIVIHDEESLKADGEEGKSKEADNMEIRIKIPFVKKSKTTAKQDNSPKQKKRSKNKKGVSEEKKEESSAQADEEDVEPKEKIQKNEPVQEEDDKPEEQVEPEQEIDEKSEEDKDSGKGGDSEVESHEEKSSDSDKIFCDEKLSRSSDGDNQGTESAEKDANPSGSDDIDKKLTPKQLEKKKEAERRRQERLDEQLKRKRKLEEEKELKRKEREEQRRKEKEEKEEQKRKEKEEKDEVKRREREEKEKKRLAELEAKNEEKRLKDEEKRLKDEEKRLKEEEKKKKEDEKRKKEEEKKEATKRISDNFKKFFMLKSKPSSNTSQPQDADKESSSDEVKSSDPRFMPFCVKPDMRLAPNTRREFKEEDKNRLDSILKEISGEKNQLYLKDIKQENWRPTKSGKTWPQEEDNEEDIIVLGDEGQPIEETKPTIKYRVKFLLFHENQRPPYYGTWRKKSSTLGPRKPFGRDQKLFDYDVDSDDEWEEEEPGESLHGSDDEKDRESEDDYEVDNDFFVPHGHLSDEELQNEDENDEDNSPEMQKAKLKLMQQEFADEMKKKTEKLKPRLIGCIWQTESGGKPTTCSEIIWKLLTASKMLFAGPIVLRTDSTGQTVSPGKENEAAEPTPSKKSNKLSEDDTRNFIRLVHGNCNNSRFLVEEFQATRAKENENRESFVEVTKVSLKRKLREVAEWKICPEPGAMQGKMCWYVNPKVREQYGHQDLTLPNTWKYILTPKRVEEPPTPAPPALSSVPEVKKDPPSSDPVAPGKPTKKRIAPLMSVPRGQNFSPATKTQLISQFLKKTTKTEEEKPPNPSNTVSFEIIHLD